MPDESCRNCGMSLRVFLKCTECRMPSQFICDVCGRRTFHQFHLNCNLAKKNPIQETWINNIGITS